MPASIPFPRHLPAHLPAHLAAPAPRPPETDADRRERHLALTRELTDLNMLAARDAAHRIATRDPDAPPDGPASADPTLALARATRAVTLIMSHENRIAAGDAAAAPFSVHDPRGLALRQLLHPLIAHEPDPARRRMTRSRINARIEDALAADLDDVPLAQIAQVIANENGIVLDITKLPDAFLEPIFPGLDPAAPAGPAAQAGAAIHARPEADTPDQR